MKRFLALCLSISSFSYAGDWPHEPVGSTVIMNWPFNALTGTDGTSGVTLNLTDATNMSIVSNPNSLTAPLTPPSVLQETFPIGLTSGISPGTFYLDPGSKTSMFTGFWWMADSNWEGDGSGVNKIIFWNDAGSASLDVQMYGTPGGPYNMCLFMEQGTSSFGRYCNTTAITLGVWHKVEVFLRYSTTSSSADGIGMLWYDGNLEVNQTTMNYDTANPLVEPQISSTWGGNTGLSKTRISYYWIDQYYVSDPGNNLPPTGGSAPVKTTAQGSMTIKGQATFK